MAKLRPNCPVALHPTSLKNQPSILDAQNPGLDSCVWCYVGLMLSIMFALGGRGELIDSRSTYMPYSGFRRITGLAASGPSS
jgi:hypothetical protein